VITHPEKVLFPDDGITKGELAAYYDEIAEVMIPHLRGRPVTMERFPQGLGAKGFLQKNVVKGFPAWLNRVETPKKGGVVHYALANNRRSLQWLANQNTITLHVWTARAPKLDRPDICIIDLDPTEDDPVALRKAALLGREVFAELGFECVIKTTGSRGFHLATRLPARADYTKSAALADQVARRMVERDPRLLTVEFQKSKRQGRILVDTERNHPGATYAAPYSVRARPGAPVSAPCTWEEVESSAITPQSVTLRTMPGRLRDLGDLWAPLLASRSRAQITGGSVSRSKTR
jgi:bifunctional non-homologous end joining protein LigD